MKRKNSLILIIIFIIALVLFYVFVLGNKKNITSITLNKDVITLLVDESEKLEVTIEPEDASDKSVIFESSDTGVVSITANGIITAIGSGNAIITAKSKNGEVFDRCVINVLDKKANEFKIREENIEIRVNESKKLDFVIKPEELRELVTWESSNKNVVTVDSDGNIMGIGAGKAEVKAVYGNTEVISNVKVVLPVDTIKMEKDIITIKKGYIERLEYSITPLSSSNQELEWTSSDENIVSVNNGEVKGIKEGTATITAKIDGKIATCQVTVTIPVTGIKLNTESLKLEKGKTTTLTATISPSDATDKTITWTSSDKKVATVDKNGKVVGVGAGEATITVTAGEKKATSKVTVYYPSNISNSKYTKGFGVVSQYNSETFKYRLQRKSNYNITLIWVLNANKQLNSALPKFGSVTSTAQILSQEISKYGYKNKGLIAINSSPFADDGWGSTPCAPLVINKGKILRDIDNTNYKKVKKYYQPIGITKDGSIKAYDFSNTSYTKSLKVKQQMLDDGVRNSFVTFRAILTPNSMNKEYGKQSSKTILCQVNNNNFVIYSGGDGLSFNAVAKELKNTFNCKYAYRLDGGSSTSLYYKTGSMPSAAKVRVGQAVPDMLYFVEQ